MICKVGVDDDRTGGNEVDDESIDVSETEKGNAVVTDDLGLLHSIPNADKSSSAIVAKSDSSLSSMSGR